MNLESLFDNSASHSLTRMQAENKRLEDRLNELGGAIPEKLNVAEYTNDKIAQEVSHKINLLGHIATALKVKDAATAKPANAKGTSKQSPKAIKKGKESFLASNTELVPKLAGIHA
jgi:hypothetical protein